MHSGLYIYGSNASTELVVDSGSEQVDNQCVKFQQDTMISGNIYMLQRIVLSCHFALNLFTRVVSRQA